MEKCMGRVRGLYFQTKYMTCNSYCGRVTRRLKGVTEFAESMVQAAFVDEKSLVNHMVVF